MRGNANAGRCPTIVGQGHPGLLHLDLVQGSCTFTMLEITCVVRAHSHPLRSLVCTLVAALAQAACRGQGAPRLSATRAPWHMMDSTGRVTLPDGQRTMATWSQVNLRHVKRRRLQPQQADHEPWITFWLDGKVRSVTDGMELLVANLWRGRPRASAGWHWMYGVPNDANSQRLYVHSLISTTNWHLSPLSGPYHRTSSEPHVGYPPLKCRSALGRSRSVGSIRV